MITFRSSNTASNLAGTLAPLGLVVGQDELAGKRVVVVSSSGEENCAVSQDVGLEGADCAVRL